MTDVVRFEEGPFAGRTISMNDGFWPPPENWGADHLDIFARDAEELEMLKTGSYLKRRQSELSDEEMAGDLGRHVVRGAEYEWVPYA